MEHLVAKGIEYGEEDQADATESCTTYERISSEFRWAGSNHCLWPSRRSEARVMTKSVAVNTASVMKSGFRKWLLRQIYLEKCKGGQLRDIEGTLGRRKGDIIISCLRCVGLPVQTHVNRSTRRVTDETQHKFRLTFKLDHIRPRDRLSGALNNDCESVSPDE
jgi:hypothetical protein